MPKVNIEPHWNAVLQDYFQTDSFRQLTEFVKEEYRIKKVFPLPQNIFRAFWLTPFYDVKVVILGQDPYHGVGQAHGLSFSVPEDITIPPSLQNIFKEIKLEFGSVTNNHGGNLEDWAKQGVLLLNSILTVVASTPASHKGKGWEAFTDRVISKISDSRENVVFMLWGNFARSKKVLIDSSKHLILEAPHPSPFSAHNGFFGCNHFKECNEYLIRNKKEPINW